LHRQLYGFTYPERAVQVYAARVEMTGRTPKPTPATRPLHRRRAKPASRTPAYFDGRWCDTPVYGRDRLRPGDHFAGPAIVLEPTSTIVVEPGWSAELTARGEVLLTAESLPGVQDDRQCASGGVQSVVGACDPVTLELFNSHFANIGEQMGATLQKTALSSGSTSPARSTMPRVTWWPMRRTSPCIWVLWDSASSA
ncbi:MAG: hypothetical protein ACYSVY_15035, partial [Planctomycetota bacterium]|jgi:5-oxoprolinase (ATP-hydrolysing)